MARRRTFRARRAVLPFLAVVGQCAAPCPESPNGQCPADGAPSSGGTDYSGASEVSSFSGGLVRLPQSERLSRVLPLTFVHMPKCGSSFVVSLRRLPGVCPGLPHIGDVPPHENVSQSGCPGMTNDIVHEGVGSQYPAVRGHMMVMLRQPEQRIISGYHNVDASGHQPHGWCYLFGQQVPGLALYAHVVHGASVKFLVRGREADEGTGFHCDHRPPTESETSLALERLRDGAAFVGLREEWPLSICLLHAMFGGECHASEMRDWHPGPKHSGRPYETEALKGFRDQHDGRLYEEGARIFRENLRLYSVSPSTCEACFRQAGLS